MRAVSLTAAALLIAAAGFPAPAGCADQPQFDTRGERIGGLHLGLPERNLASRLSCRQPDKTREELEGATGLYVQDWSYPDCGIRLHMGSKRKGGAKVINAIILTSPSQLATGWGVRIGSTEEEVANVYGRFRDPEESQSGSLFVAGSIYDGLIFNLADGKVVQIFLGGAAE